MQAVKNAYKEAELVFKQLDNQLTVQETSVMYQHKEYGAYMDNGGVYAPLN